MPELIAGILSLLLEPVFWLIFWLVVVFLRLIVMIVAMVRPWRVLPPSFRTRIKAGLARYGSVKRYYDRAMGMAQLMAAGVLVVVACVWLVTAVASPPVQPPKPTHRNFAEVLRGLLPHRSHAEP